LDQLKKAFKSGKQSDIAAACYTDICKAATFLPVSETTPLRSLAPTLQAELDEKLFDPKTPFKNSDNEIDHELMSESLVSSFRLSQVTVINSLFPECLKADAPAHFKMALVTSLLRIATEGSH
jgi:neurofibromin 1